MEESIEAISIDDYRSGLIEAGFTNVELIDTRADLNVYAQVGDHSCCCSPSMVATDNSSDAEDACRSTDGLHAELGHLLNQYDVNQIRGEREDLRHQACDEMSLDGCDAFQVWRCRAAVHL
jgi:hypothetical protein